jgi:predicted transposase YdaD
VSKPYDASLKALVETCPADWPRFLGVPADSVELLDADVSTITAATDKVLLIHGPDGDHIQHLDFQAGPDAGIPVRVHGYNALLAERHALPVETVVVLLARKANLAVISGLHERSLPAQTSPYLRFEYRVVRVWELPTENLLTAGVSLLPLAPLSAVTQGDLPSVIERMRSRIELEASPIARGELWTAAEVLLGLNFDAPFVERLLQGVMAMEESSTYQAILARGEAKGKERARVDEALRILLQLGADRFGKAPESREQTSLDSVTDAERLEELIRRVHQCHSWAELLGLSAAPARRTRRKKT